MIRFFVYHRSKGFRNLIKLSLDTFVYISVIFKDDNKGRTIVSLLLTSSCYSIDLGINLPHAKKSKIQ